MNALSRVAAITDPPTPTIALFVPTIAISLFIFSCLSSINLKFLDIYLIYSFCLANKDNVSADIFTKCNNRTRKCLQELCWNNGNVEAKLNAETYNWTRIIMLATCGLGIFSTAVLGAWGDRHNRKHAILVPVAGSTIGAVLSFLLAYLAPERLILLLLLMSYV